MMNNWLTGKELVKANCGVVESLEERIEDLKAKKQTKKVKEDITFLTRKLETFKRSAKF